MKFFQVVKVPVGIGVGLAVGLELGFGLPLGDPLGLGLGETDADGVGTGSVGMTVNVGIGDCGDAGIWYTLLREFAAATAETSNAAESPMTATERRQCVLNMTRR